MIVRALPDLGDVTAVFNADPLAFLQATLGHGDVLQFTLAGERYTLFHHPDAIHDILVTHADKFGRTAFTRQTLGAFLGAGLLVSDGALHREQRRLLQPAFHHRALQTYTAVMHRHAERLVTRWQPGQTLDMRAEMERHALYVVAEALFGEDAAAFHAPIHDFITAMGVEMAREWAPGERALTPESRAAVTRLDAEIARLIAARQTDPGERSDLLSALLAGGGMSAAQLRDEVVTLLAAGHETTSVTLSWTWWLLSENPAAEAALQRVAVESPTSPDVPYATQVIRETLRLYPTAWILFNRAVVEGTEIGGVSLPAGSTVMLSPYAVQRDSRWYADPEVFRPERFSAGWEATLPRFAYLPFGGGPRVCIGQHFALMEAASVLTTVARRFRVRLAAGAAARPLPSTTLQPAPPLLMQVEEIIR